MTRLGQMLIEEGMEKGMEKGIEKGIEKGREEDRGRINSLILKLAELDRIGDITRAAKDRPYQEELLREFGL